MCFIEEEGFIQEYGTIIASVVALIIAIWGWKMKSLFKKPKFKIIAIKKYKQSEILNVWRILIRNVGNETAKNVESEILRVYDNKKERDNFLPCPLRWSNRQDLKGHFSSRNILPNQIAFIDFFDEIDRGDKLDMRFGTIIDLENVEDFSFLKDGNSLIELGIFCENAKTEHLKFECELLGNKKEIRIILKK